MILIFKNIKKAYNPVIKKTAGLKVDPCRPTLETNDGKTEKERQGLRNRLRNKINRRKDP